MASIYISSLAAFSRSLGAAVVALAFAAGSVVWSAAPHFYPDDPIWSDDDQAFDASKVVAIEDTNGYDFVVNTFAGPGERRDVRALNVNTVDEVPDSSWFTNRIGRRDLPVADVVKGPDRAERVSLDGWVVSGGKSRRASSIRSSSTLRRIRSWRAAPRSSGRRFTMRSATTRSRSSLRRSIARPSSFPSRPRFAMR
jgi:hypothetical protein